MNWASKTKTIPINSPAWTKFGELALTFNETWNFHPWMPGGRTLSSHIHALFGWAVKEEHIPLLMLVLGTGPGVLRICDMPLIGESLPALHVAARLGHERVVRHLLRICAVNERDAGGQTALHHAARKAHTAIVRLLIDTKGVDISLRSKSNHDPVWLAVLQGLLDVLKLLMSKLGREVRLDDDVYIEAARLGNAAILRELLSGDAPHAKYFTDRCKAMVWAAKNGAYEGGGGTHPVGRLL
jgi:hypothetical protein